MSAAYGPIGAALGSFVGFADDDARAAIADALSDAASHEWEWMMQAGSEQERVYHRDRWYDLLAA